MKRLLNSGFGLVLLSGAMSLLADEVSCEGAYTTLALNHCAEEALRRDEQQLNQAWSAVIARYQDDKPTMTALQQGQLQWQQYRAAHCQAIATHWRQGSIRGLMFLHCQSRLTRQREDELRTQLLIDR